MMRRLGVSLVTVLALSACTATSIDYNTFTAEEFIKAPQWMEIRPSVPKDVVVVGEVTAEICNKKRSDPIPTDETILNLLKLRAAEKGGTRLADVTFKVTPEGTDTCFSYARASGTAFIHK
ncbi:MAG: hypothetical protein ABIQ30_06315 [Devosia sp.]